MALPASPVAAGHGAAPLAANALRRRVGTPRVVLLSGVHLDLPPPPSPDEPVCSLRARVAAALELDVERVVLVAGTKILQNQWSVSASAGGRDLTALVAEAILDTDDPQNVAEYASDIFRGVLHRTTGPLSAINFGVCERSSPSATLLDDRPPDAKSEPGLDPASRSVLVDWIVEEHQKFDLRTETLFLAVAILDAFQRRRAPPEGDLRLLGAAALLVAAKFEEIYPPELRDFVYMTDQEYTAEDIKSMEVLVLSVLEFRIAGQTAAHFMSRYQSANRCSDVQTRFVQYLLELALVDEITTLHEPHKLAAAAILVTNRLFHQKPEWPPTMVNYTAQTEEDLAECASDLQQVFQDARYSAFQRVRSKLDQDPVLQDAVEGMEKMRSKSTPRTATSASDGADSDGSDDSERTLSRSPRARRR